MSSFFPDKAVAEKRREKNPSVLYQIKRFRLIALG